MKEFMTRTTTAFFLITGSYLLIRFVPPVYFSVLIYLIISAGTIELFKLTKPQKGPLWLMFLNGIPIALSFTFGKPDLAAAVMITVVITGIYFLFSMKQRSDLTHFVRDLGIQFIAVFYLYIPLYYLFKLKELAPNYLFFLIFVIIIGDSAAYFLGRPFGKHKIYPVASPKKSLEGLIAAILFAGVSGWLSLLLFPVAEPVSVAKAVITGAVIGFLSQVSDPIESLFKRAADQKDSGALLPGHGGVLDRVDSYIFCAPALFYIITYCWK
ncbi:MAG: phosphatidate cytidylyltransferase [Candidatus Omnitrophota bacterium]